MSIHIAAEKGQIAPSVLLPGDPLRARHIAENYLEDAFCYTDIRNMLGYTGRYKGVPVSVQGTGMGMPSMGIYSYELMNEYNVENLIRVGTCGSFSEKIHINDIILAIAASTDSNFSHAFQVPVSFAPCASWELLTKAYDINREMNLSMTAGNVVSCDVFYETEENWWKKWSDMNVLAVEMEAAALYMNAAWFRRNAMAMMTVTDHFITGARSTTEERLAANDSMIRLALETAVR